MEEEKFIDADFKTNIIIGIVYSCILVLISALILGYASFSVYSITVEIIIIIISVVMGTIAFSTYKANKENIIIFLGLAYIFIAALNLIHLFIYKVIVGFVDDSFNISMQIWIAIGYMESLSFLISFMLADRILHMRKILLAYLITFILILTSIFYWDNFPDCYIKDIGFTPFKVISQYIIFGVLLFGIVILIGQKRQKIKGVDILIVLSIISIVISKLFLVHHIHVYDWLGVFGHAFRLISVCFLYMALIKSSVQKPYTSLYQKNNTFNAILESTGKGILVIDNDNKIIHFNSKFTDMIDIFPDEFSPELCDGYFVNDKSNNSKEIKKIINEPIKGNRGKSYGLRARNGRMLEVSVLPFLEKGLSSGKLISFKDITEEYEMKELQRKAEIRQSLLEKSREVEDLKSTFIRTISHEIKTPLNVILGTTQLISFKDNGNPYFQVSKDNIEMIEKNCFRLVKLTDNLIDINKIDSGFMYLNLENHDIVAIIEDIVQSVIEHADCKGISLIFDTDIEERIIAFDIEALQRVILNLLSNAIKFTEFGGKIEVSIKDKSESVLISVKDNGAGIPRDMVDTIFDKFKQVDSSLTRKQEGSGIGLSIVKSMVEMHGGKISLNSELDKGTEFIIKLPRKLMDDKKIGNSSLIDKSVDVDRIQIEFSDIYELN